MDGRLDLIIERAYEAATGGRAVELDAALDALRRLDAQEAFLIQDRLRAIARSVRSHPAGSGTVGRRAS